MSLQPVKSHLLKIFRVQLVNRYTSIQPTYPGVRSVFWKHISSLVLTSRSQSPVGTFPSIHWAWARKNNLHGGSIHTEEQLDNPTAGTTQTCASWNHVLFLCRWHRYTASQRQSNHKSGGFVLRYRNRPLTQLQHTSKFYSQISNHLTPSHVTLRQISDFLNLRCIR